MPTRKQRRRRQKSFRHEYETVLIDEEGNELSLDPDELRAEREAREQERVKAKPSAKQTPGRTGRLGREPQPPSWQRALRRGALFGSVMFVAFVFVLRGGSPTGRAITGLLYGLAFIPLTYWMDRFAYRMYQRRQGNAGGQGSKKASRTAKS
jgi:hypothetical protein